MEKNGGLLLKNEQEANRFAANITLATIVLVAIVYILDMVDIFIAPKGLMTIAMIISAVLLSVPSILVYVFKRTDAYVKYVIVINCVLMVDVLCTLLNWHVIVMFLYPMAISSLYFSRKLSWVTSILSLVFFSLAQIGAFYMDAIVDNNLKTLYEVVVYGVAPRGLQLIAVSLIFIALSKRTKKLLQNVLGAEEQKEMLDHIMVLTNKSYEVTNTLAESVRTLSDLTEHAMKSNEEITNKADYIVSGSQQTMRYVTEASDVVAEATSQLYVIAKDNTEISSVSNEAKTRTDQNTENMKNAADGMKQIEEATRESRHIILQLGEKSNQIAGIIQTITGIASKTHLLALNASIESARAGEQGKGFAVVASEIRDLAEQSAQATKSAAELLQSIIEDTSLAVKSIDMNTKVVENGISLIEKANQSSEEVTNTIEKVDDMAKKIASISSTVAVTGNQIKDAVDEISKLTANSLEELKTILSASEDQLKAMNEVSSSVESINRTSEELLQVVNVKKA